MKPNPVAKLISHPAPPWDRESPQRNPAHRRGTTLRRNISAIFVLLSVITAFAAFGVPVNTSWTYQGQLQRSGAAYNGTCNFQFSLWNAAIAGSQQGSTQSINTVNVVNGLFTVTLDFEDAFDGGARWLGTSVQCTGDGGFTQLNPRQPLTATPYALSLRPGASILGEGNLISALTVANSAGIGIVGTGSTGVWGQSQSGDAIYGQNDSGDGFAGRFVGPVSVETNINSVPHTAAIQGEGAIGVQGNSTSPSGRGVTGTATGTDAIGVSGANNEGRAVSGVSTWERDGDLRGEPLRQRLSRPVRRSCARPGRSDESLWLF